jgi:hypothetical protein
MYNNIQNELVIELWPYLNGWDSIFPEGAYLIILLDFEVKSTYVYLNANDSKTLG